MNGQTLILYSIVIVMILSGLIPCWRSSLSIGKKYFWSALILILPGAGTLFYFGYKDQISMREQIHFKYRDEKMNYKRSIVAGMTDYTGVLIEDIVEHLKEWESTTLETINNLKTIRDDVVLKKDIFENYSELLSFIEDFLNLFERYHQDINRLCDEVPRSITNAHIETVKQLLNSSQMAEKRTVLFKSMWIEKGLPDESARPLLDRIYSETRCILVDFYDLSNLEVRMKSLVTASIEGQSNKEALSFFHLKPNIFGIGLNLNRILGLFR